MPRGARRDLGPLATERIKVFPERFNVFHCVVVDRLAALLRLRNDAVVDIRNIHRLRHAQTLELQISSQYIRRNRRPKIPNVPVIPNRRPAVIKSDLAFD